MIPKIIHYCWFGGGELDKFTLECIESRKKNLPNYEIMKWSEDNCDIENSPDFVKRAYKEKKWAFVSDFFRLQVLIEYGGVYLDTDVKVLKPFDDLLELDFFCSFESDKTLCTAVIGACKENKVLKEFIQMYANMDFSETPNSFLLFNFLKLDELKKIDIQKKYLIDDKQMIFPFYYFSPIDFYTGANMVNIETYSIHYYKGTWKSNKQKVFDKIKIIAYKILGKENYQKLKNAIKNKKKQ